MFFSVRQFSLDRVACYAQGNEKGRFQFFSKKVFWYLVVCYDVILIVIESLRGSLPLRTFESLRTMRANIGEVIVIIDQKSKRDQQVQRNPNVAKLFAWKREMSLIMGNGAARLSPFCSVFTLSKNYADIFTPFLPLYCRTHDHRSQRVCRAT